jgi:hypothetical protein
MRAEASMVPASAATKSWVQVGAGFAQAVPGGNQRVIAQQAIKCQRTRRRGTRALQQAWIKGMMFHSLPREPCDYRQKP